MRHTDLCMWLRLRGAPYGLFEYDITFCDSQHRQSFHTLTQTFLWPQLIAALVRFNPQKVQVDPAGPLNQNFQGRGWACDQDTCEKHLPQLPSLVTYREGNEDWAAGHWPSSGSLTLSWALFPSCHRHHRNLCHFGNRNEQKSSWGEFLFLFLLFSFHNNKHSCAATHKMLIALPSWQRPEF